MKNRALKRLIYSLSVLLAFLSYFPVTSYGSIKKDTVINNTGFKIKTIIIDAGHGANPAGAGHFSPGASGSFSKERNVTLAIALKLQKAVEKDMTGVKAVLTRANENDVSFERRAEIANENKGDVFISIHCNSLSDRRVSRRVGTKHHKPVYKTSLVPDRSGKGVLLLVYALKRTREAENEIKRNQVEGDSELDGGALDPNDPITIILTNEYKRKFRQQSINLATLLNKEFVETDGRPSDGIRDQSIYVLCHSSMPSVLVETGYINNPDDEAYLNSEEGQNTIVNSIVRALTNFKNEVEQVSK
ncbi:N-acetylmuramoyl-L-alanine amidase family protein [Mucilaginibacter lappiensis]|uniref:N-acetylmuramoyl-L-alanine amidase n=1 Tax=Mucilaginibacter lappiensis TaxID=354630 RepID=A0A1N7GCZ9_9SPHI|nr:N-acetylmuramoyl-L-alanine amidase [Mucilaginibacter lappiensis]MBB6112996.1 N-acetylmuramoyl-L-alanine amidase [Mucilaginibacter lappiensis]MBB6127476.1 N-acetylmuramoyl-L-alanine amidase [Mucilaginibacter lappiensis]SIS10441.1 N-acetylmuramoyl-L-alanine amidase [Mucilaginibacter lappiensis]